MAKAKRTWKLNIIDICILFMLLLPIVMVMRGIYLSQQATVENTYVTENTIRDVEVIETGGSRGRGRNTFLFLDHDDGFFLLDPEDDKAEAIAEAIRAHNGVATLTVWEHFPRSIFLASERFGWTEEVVAVSFGDETVYDISEHNAKQRSERTDGLLGAGFIAVLFSPCLFFMWILKNGGEPLLTWLRKRSKKEKREKRK